MKSALPSSVFAGVALGKTSINISIRTRRKKLEDKKILVGIDPVSTLLAFVRNFSKKNNVNFIGCGYTNSYYHKEAANQLWLHENISPFFINIKNLDKVAKIVASFFDENNSFKAQTQNGKVITPFLVSLDNYEKITPVSLHRFSVSNISLRTGRRYPHL